MTPLVFALIGFGIVELSRAALQVWRVRRFDWTRSTKAFGWVVARSGDRGEEYRSIEGAWSQDGGAIYAMKERAELTARRVDGAYALPLRIDPRASREQATR